MTIMDLRFIALIMALLMFCLILVLDMRLTEEEERTHAYTRRELRELKEIEKRLEELS